MFSAPLIDVIVPLHAEGVDRNKHYYDETMLYKVPLHAEGVDRNPAAIRPGVLLRLPSMRRAWIEICPGTRKERNCSFKLR